MRDWSHLWLVIVYSGSTLNQLKSNIWNGFLIWKLLMKRLYSEKVFIFICIFIHLSICLFSFEFLKLEEVQSAVKINHTSIFCEILLSDHMRNFWCSCTHACIFAYLSFIVESNSSWNWKSFLKFLIFIRCSNIPLWFLLWVTNNTKIIIFK